MRNRRLYRRVSIEADLEIDGAPAKLLDLSMGGFAAANAPALAANEPAMAAAKKGRTKRIGRVALRLGERERRIAARPRF